jgi:pimeloyl-ACP methyl ester carboxylesterase
MWRTNEMRRAVFAAFFALAAMQPAFAQTKQTQMEACTMTIENLTIPAAAKTGYSEINGVNYYYEIRGEGEPLLLLHGGLGTIEMFGPALGHLSGARTVISVDLHGHGRTELGDRAIDLKDMGDDMAALIGRLGHEKADVLGYSLGGSVGLRMAIQHPEAVRRLVVASAVHARDGFYPEIREAQKQLSADAAAFMKETPMYHS